MVATFNQSQDSRPDECDVIGWKKCRLQQHTGIRMYVGTTEWTQTVLALQMNDISL